MALSEFQGDITLVSSGDLSTKQYLLVKIDTNGQVAVASTGECAVGVLANKPSAQGQAAQVSPLDGRIRKAICAGVTKGDLLKSDNTGKIATAVKGKTDTSDAGAAADPLIGSHVVGVALETRSSGELCEFLALPLGAVPTTAA